MMLNPRLCFNLAGLFALSFFPAESFAQTSIVSPGNSIINSEGIEFPTEIYQIRPNQPTGPRFDIELPDGLSCSSSNGTPPALNFYGGSTKRDNSYQSFPDYTAGGHSIGAVLSLPLARTSSPKCDDAYNLYLTNKKIELIENLYDSGVLSDDQVQTLAIKVLGELGFEVDALLETAPDSSSMSSSDLVAEPYVVEP